MKLIVDIGNSNIVVAVKDGDGWARVFRYETKDNQPQFYYERGLANLFLEWGIAASDFSSSIVSSVVPELNTKIINAIEKVLPLRAVLIDPEILKHLDMHVPHVNEIGTDLVANAYAALKMYHKPAIVVDFGTALSFTIMHPDHGIQGVTIAPGVKTAFGSLSMHTAQLPLAAFSKPQSAIGQNTSHAIQAGIIIGYEGLVKHLIAKMKEELEGDYIVVGTGGLSEVLSHITDEFDVVNKLLTLEGINLIHDHIVSLQKK
jgi:type III pantothenate kinase